MRNFTILAVLVGSFFAYSASAALYVPDINGLYHFDDDSVDSSGNGYNGTADNGITYEAGMFENAARTNGDNSISFSTDVLHTADDFTVGFWLKPKESFATDDGPYIIMKPNVSSQYMMFSYSIACTADSIEYRHNAVCSAEKPYTFNTDGWYFVVFRRSGNLAEIYINNSLEDSGTDAVNTDGTGAVTVNYTDLAAEADDFIIDELFFSNTSIPTSTLTNIYNSGDGVEICVTEGCDETTPSSTPSSTTSTSTDMTTYETVITYYLVFLTVLGGAWFGYKLLT